jgi:NAD(P)-dependent dehydrogenase (short-subunit alcohol dehydrogenase family)
MIVVITGGTSGFGRDLAERLVSKGHRVVIGDLQEDKEFMAQLNSGSTRAIYQKCNVLVQQEILSLLQRAEKEFGKVDVVVNNAGIAESTPFAINKTQDWIKVLDIDLKAVIMGTQLALQQFEKQQSGGIILNTASLAGLVPAPYQPVYAAAKAGVVNFTRSLGYLAKERDVRVIAICPSFVKTKLTNEAIQNGFDIKQWVDIRLVTDAFMMAMEDSMMAGEIIRITPQYGIDFPFRRNAKKVSKL